MKTFSYPKAQRLCQREVLADLSAKGSVIFKYPFKAYMLPGSSDVSRYAVAVPKKSFKRAVKRNLLKRRTREAIRLNQAGCLRGKVGDYLFVYIAKDVCAYEEMEAAVKEILSKSAAV